MLKSPLRNTYNVLCAGRTPNVFGNWSIKPHKWPLTNMLPVISQYYCLDSLSYLYTIIVTMYCSNWDIWGFHQRFYLI